MELKFNKGDKVFYKGVGYLCVGDASLCLFVVKDGDQFPAAVYLVPKKDLVKG